MNLMHLRLRIDLACSASFFILLSGTFVATAFAQPTTRPAHFEKTITKTLSYDYLVWQPRDYGKGKKVPLLIMLHGSGSCGHDLSKLRDTQVLKYAATHPDFPFMVVLPQSPSEKDWWSLETLDAWLDDVMSKYDVDPDRVYLTGISMGAYGVWDWACHRPDRFAAIAPLAGEGNDDLAAELKHVPVWAFHGARDTAVSPAEEVRMVDAVNRTGGSAKLTMYPDLGHNIGTRTYSSPELYAWLLEHRRSHESR